MMGSNSKRESSMRILNLGCGTKTSSRPEVLNIDLSPYLLMKRTPVLRALAPLILSGQRLQRFRALPANVLHHDLATGIPFESGSIDVVYHSQVLEHMDRWEAPVFLREIRRVLKTGGVLRVVVPDFAKLCREYLEHLERCDKEPSEAKKHDAYVAALIEQSVRREAFGTSGQNPYRRRLENLLLGDARKRKETHQWAYDKVNLRELLVGIGYTNIVQCSFDSSLVPGWIEYGLDTDEAGHEYKPSSLYMEAQK